MPDKKNNYHLYRAIKEFFDSEKSFRQSMQIITDKKNGAEAKLSASQIERLDFVLSPYTTLTENSLALTSELEQTLEKILSDNEQEAAEASQIMLDYIHFAFEKILISETAAFEQGTANVALLNTFIALDEKTMIKVNRAFIGDDGGKDLVSHAITAAQRPPRYQMLSHAIADTAKSIASEPIKVAIQDFSAKMKPKTAQFSTRMNDNRDRIDLKNKAILLLIDLLVSRDKQGHKKAVDHISSIITDVVDMNLSTEEDLKILETKLHSTTKNKKLFKAFSQLIADNKEMILRKPAVTITKEENSAALATSPSIQIKTTTDNINLSSEIALQSMRDSLKKETWIDIKTKDDTSNPEYTFQKKDDENTTTASFVVKRTLISTKDRSTNTYRAMINAFIAACPNKPLKITAVNEAEYNKAKSICEEIKAANPAFVFSINNREKAAWQASIKPVSFSNVAAEKHPASEAVLDHPLDTHEDIALVDNVPDYSSEISEEVTLSDDIDDAEDAPLLQTSHLTQSAPLSKETDPEISKLEKLIDEFKDAVEIEGPNKIARVREKLASIADIIFKNPKAADRFDLNHYADIQAGIKQLNVSNKKETELNNILRPSVVRETKEPSILTKALNGLKSRYKKMSTLKKVAFWVGVTVAAVAVVGVIAGLTAATGGASNAVVGIGLGVAFGSKLIAGVSAVVGAIGAVVAITQIAKDPTGQPLVDADKPEEVKKEAIEMKEFHSSDYGLGKSLGPKNIVGNDTSLKAKPVLNSLPKVDSSAPPAIQSAHDEPKEANEHLSDSKRASGPH